MNVIELNANAQVIDSAYNAKLSTEIEIIDSGGATRYYGKLIGKPAINHHELQSGDNSLSDIGVTQLIDQTLGNLEALLETI